jgi:hypothetical protein
MILIYNWSMNIRDDIDKIFTVFLCSEQYWLSLKGKKNNNKNIANLKTFSLPDILENRNSTVEQRSLFRNIHLVM